MKYRGMVVVLPKNVRTPPAIKSGWGKHPNPQCEKFHYIDENGKALCGGMTKTKNTVWAEDGHNDKDMRNCLLCLRRLIKARVAEKENQKRGV